MAKYHAFLPTLGSSLLATAAYGKQRRTTENGTQARLMLLGSRQGLARGSHAA